MCWKSLITRWLTQYEIQLFQQNLENGAKSGKKEENGEIN